MAVLAVPYWALLDNVLLSTIPNLTIYAINPYLSQRQLNIPQLARRSARKLNSAFWDQRQVQISLYINAGNRDALDRSLDSLNALLQGLEKQLVIPQSGSSRQYTVTFSKAVINNSSTGSSSFSSPQGGFVDMTLIFECSDSYGYDTNYTVIEPATNITAAVVNTQYTQGGSAERQVPIVQAKVTAVTGGTAASISIGNLATGQQATVTRTWGVSDILIIDTQHQTVQVNSVDVNFTGSLPEFAPGLQTLTYQDTFTTRTVNLFAYVYNRWN